MKTATKSAGYSVTPLPKKLGIRDGGNSAILNAPPGYMKSLGIKAVSELNSDLDFIQFFTKSRAELEKQLPRLRKAINIEGAADVIRTVRAAGYSLDVEG